MRCWSRRSWSWRSFRSSRQQRDHVHIHQAHRVVLVGTSVCSCAAALRARPSFLQLVRVVTLRGGPADMVEAAPHSRQRRTYQGQLRCMRGGGGRGGDCCVPFECPVLPTNPRHDAQGVLSRPDGRSLGAEERARRQRSQTKHSQTRTALSHTAARHAQTHNTCPRARVRTHKSAHTPRIPHAFPPEPIGARGSLTAAAAQYSMAWVVAPSCRQSSARCPIACPLTDGF